MFLRAFLRLVLLGDLTAGRSSEPCCSSFRSSISMTTTCAPLAASAPGPRAPARPANRYFLSLRDSPSPLDFFSLAALVLLLWSSMAYSTGVWGRGAHVSHPRPPARCPAAPGGLPPSCPGPGSR